MKEVKVKLYEFSELSEQAKERVRDDNRERYGDTSWIYDDAHKSIEKFDDIFGTRSGNHSWLDLDLSYIDDKVLGLQGERLQRYIWNNYRRYLWKGRYHTVEIKDKKVMHNRVKCSGPYKSGNYHNAYYSAVFVDYNCCVLTGVCYDDDLLKPIYDFMNARPEGSILTTNFQDLLEDCYFALKNSIENESDYMQTDEYIDEQMEGECKMFLENGEEFTGEILEEICVE